MKKISKLKLNKLSKANMEEKELQKIHGGNYCAWGDENRDANNDQGKCSCACGSGSYYSALDQQAQFYKATDAWGYC